MTDFVSLSICNETMYLGQARGVSGSQSSVPFSPFAMKQCIWEELEVYQAPSTAFWFALSAMKQCIYLGRAGGVSG